eukprot:3596291-Rhodomonas_salina.1
MRQNRIFGSGSIGLQFCLLAAFAVCSYGFVSTPQAVAGRGQSIALRRTSAQSRSIRMAAGSRDTLQANRNNDAGAKRAGLFKKKLSGVVSALVLTMVCHDWQGMAFA